MRGKHQRGCSTTCWATRGIRRFDLWGIHSSEGGARKGKRKILFKRKIGGLFCAQLGNLRRLLLLQREESVAPQGDATNLGGGGETESAQGRYSWNEANCSFLRKGEGLYFRGTKREKKPFFLLRKKGKRGDLSSFETRTGSVRIEKGKTFRVRRRKEKGREI